MSRSVQGSIKPPSAVLKVLGVVSSVGMLVINLVGFLDTETGSALGCGRDWPLCNGHVIPALSNTQVDIEFLHRVLVAGFALIAAVFLIWALIAYRQFIEVKILAWVGIGFIVIQSALGALAVVFVNPPPILALHLGFGLLAMVGTVLLAVFIFQMGAKSGGQTSGLTLRMDSVAYRTRYWVLGIWAYTYVAIYFGSYVAFRGAGEACSTWPLCNGEIFPGFSGKVGLDFAHRLFAVGLAILAVGLLIHLRSISRSRPDLMRGSVWFLVAVLMQVASGANLSLSHFSTGPYMLHIMTLMFLFVTLSYLGMQVLPAGSASHRPVSPPHARASRQVRPQEHVVKES